MGGPSYIFGAKIFFKINFIVCARASLPGSPSPCPLHCAGATLPGLSAGFVGPGKPCRLCPRFGSACRRGRLARVPLVLSCGRLSAPSGTVSELVGHSSGLMGAALSLPAVSSCAASVDLHGLPAGFGRTGPGSSAPSAAVVGSSCAYPGARTGKPYFIRAFWLLWVFVCGGHSQNIPPLFPKHSTPSPL